jgi:hypothetical protein
MVQRFKLFGCQTEQNQVMKLLYLFYVVVCATILSSCSKDSQHVNGRILPGVWELRARSGGMIPYNANNYKPGNGDLWAFKQTGFARIFKDSVYERGTYSISLGTGTDLNTGRKIDQFIFNNVPAGSFELRSDTLKFYYGAIASDGGIQMYVKISDDTTSIK